MLPEEKQAFEHFAKTHDGIVILDYYKKMLNKFADIRNLKEGEDARSRQLACDIIEREVVKKIESFNEKLVEGNDSWV